MNIAKVIIRKPQCLQSFSVICNFMIYSYLIITESVMNEQIPPS